MMQPGMVMQQQPGMIMVAQNPNQMVPQRGDAMCYRENCPNSGVKQCKAFICCKDYGCGKMMCEDHRSKKCIMRNEVRGPPQYACTTCEPRAVKCSRLFLVLPMCLCILFILTIAL